VAGTSETQRRVDDALRRGCRGLPEGSSLRRVLMAHARRCSARQQLKQQVDVRSIHGPVSAQVVNAFELVCRVYRRSNSLAPDRKALLVQRELSCQDRRTRPVGHKGWS
jgi:hypothetical protein